LPVILDTIHKWFSFQTPPPPPQIDRDDLTVPGSNITYRQHKAILARFAAMKHPEPPARKRYDESLRPITAYLPVKRARKDVVIHQASGDEVISFGDIVDLKSWELTQKIRAWFIAHGLWANPPDTRPRIWIDPHRDARPIKSSTDRVQ
jgi:hypothetical protein